MPSADDFPDVVRNEFARLRHQLDSLIERRDRIKAQLRSLRNPSRERINGVTALMKNLVAELHDVKNQITETKMTVITLIREYGESSQEAESRMQSSAAGDPMHLKKPVAHSKLYGHGVRLGCNPNCDEIA